MNIMTLGNMKAKIEFDQDAELFRGAIPGLTGSADFYGKTVAELKCEFKKSLAVYLDECTRRRIEPYKSFHLFNMIVFFRAHLPTKFRYRRSCRIVHAEESVTAYPRCDPDL